MVVTWFKTHEIYKSHINYSIAYPKTTKQKGIVRILFTFREPKFLREKIFANCLKVRIFLQVNFLQIVETQLKTGNAPQFFCKIIISNLRNFFPMKIFCHTVPQQDWDDTTAPVPTFFLCINDDNILSLPSSGDQVNNGWIKCSCLSS